MGRGYHIRTTGYSRVLIVATCIASFALASPSYSAAQTQSGATPAFVSRTQADMQNRALRAVPSLNASIYILNASSSEPTGLDQASVAIDNSIANLDLARQKANADAASDLSSLKKARNARETAQRTIATKLAQKRAQLNITGDNAKNEQLHASIASLETQLTTSIGNAAKTDAASLKTYNTKLKQRFDAGTALTAVEKASIAYAEPDYLFAQDDAPPVVPTFPNDTELPNQWYLGRIISQYPTTFASVSQINHPILVAVIDSGVDYTNPELKPNMWSSTLCVDENGTPVSGGCVNGYDFVDNDAVPLPTDGNDHGTAVASIIAAETGNGVGMASLSQNRAQIMALRVADQGYIQESALIRAIYFAVNNNAQIINLSLSGPTYSQALYDALAYAQSHGVIIVTSAGNLGQNIDQNPVYPASYSLANIIPVAALSQSGALSSYSDYGPTIVKVAAPGDNIWAASLNDTYTNHTGTSFAAPLIVSYLVHNLSLNISATSTIQNLPSASGLAGYVAGGKAFGLAAVAPSTPQPIQTALYQDMTGQWVNPQSKGGEYANPATFVASSTYQLDGAPGVPSPYWPGTTASPGTQLTSISGNYLGWYSSSGATNYGVYIRDITTNTLIVDNDYAGNVTAYAIPMLTPGHYYRWNMRASNSSGWSAYTTPLYFYVPSLSAPTSLTPGSTSYPGSTLPGTSATLSWGSVTNATYYYVVYTDLSTNASYSYSPSSTSQSVSSLTPGHTYSWYVQACTSNGCSAQSSTYYFTTPTANHPPSTPAISGASSVQVGTTYTATFTSSDLDNDTLQYTINWGDGTVQTYGNYSPGAGVTLSHAYTTAGTYTITAQAYDGKAYGGTNALQLTVTPVPLATYDIVPVALSLNQSSLLPGQSVTVNVTLKNLGTGTITAPFTVAFYLAPQAAGLSTAYPLGTLTWNSSLPSNTLVAQAATLALPPYGSSAYTSAGTYSIIAIPDSTNAITEVSETNNRANQYGVDYSQFTLQSIAGSGTGQPQLTLTLDSGSPTVGSSVTAHISSSGIPSGTQVNLSTSLSTGNITPNKFTLNNGSASGPITFTQPGVQTITASANGISYTTSAITVNAASSGGIMLSSSAITIKVTDSFGTPLSGASVKISCTADIAASCASYWSGTTNASGVVSIPRGYWPIVVPAVHVSVNYTDTTNTPHPKEFDLNVGSVDALSDQSISLNVDNTHIPVILLPGIMGSTDGKTSKIWSASLPAGDANESNLDLMDPLGVVGWGTLEADLVAQNYQKGKTIIRCPYDWRMRIADEATKYLAVCINNALAANPQATKVDIIAHSQGGLVTRAYVQSSATNAAKIRKIAFVGTPQYGSSEAYFAWEGGDMDDLPSLTLPTTWLRPKSDTARNIYRTMTGKELPSSSPVPNALVDKCASAGSYYSIATCMALLSLDYESYVNDPNILQPFIQSSVKSIKQLMPTYSFLKNTSGTPIAISSANENEFLKALNNESCQDGTCDDSIIGNGSTYSFVPLQTVAQSNGISVAMFYDNSPRRDTIGDIVVGSSTNANIYLYTDGTPAAKVKNTQGDETVPVESINPFINSFTYPAKITSVGATNDPTHPTLVNDMLPQILAFILGTQVSSISLAAANPTLYISASGPVQALLTDPQGNKKGLDANGVAYDSISDAMANIAGGKNEFVIPNPNSGNYTLSLSGMQVGHVEINIGYNDGTNDSKTESKSITLYHQAGTQTLTFTAQQ